MKQKKIFHGPVNYGTQAGFFAKALRYKGFSAKSYTNHDQYGRLTDYSFKKRNNILSKLIWYKFVYPLIRFSCFFKYDIFHFYFGRTLHHKQWDLPLYRVFGKKVVMHYLGNDIEEYQWSIDNYEITNMRDLMSPQQGVVHDAKIKKRRSFEKKYLDAEIVCAPQYSPFAPHAMLIPLGIDLKQYEYVQFDIKKNEALKVLHAATSRKKKGTKYLIEAVEKLKAEGLNIELVLCEDVSHAKLKEKFKECHVSVVALLGGWYGTAGIEAMAIGRPIISYLRPEFIAYTDLDEDDIPIINANAQTIYEVLKDTYHKRFDLPALGARSRLFVEKNHSYLKLADKLSEIYTSI